MAKSVGALNYTVPSVGPLETPSLGLTQTFSDSISVGDVLLSGLGAIFNETITFSDNYVAPGAPLVAIETLSFADNYLAILSLPLTLNDAVNFIDGYTTALGININFSEDLSVSLADNYSHGIGLASQFNDQLSFNDNLVTFLYIQLTSHFSETFTFLDSVIENLIGKVTTTIPTTSAGQPEVIVFSDSFKHFLTIVANFSDTLSLVDNLSAFVPLTVSLNETFSLSELVQGGLGASLIDSISVTDNYNATNAAPFLALTLQIGEQLAIGDLYNNQQMALIIQLNLIEALSFHDSIQTQLDLGLNSYLRRYLNDVTLGVN